MYHQTAGQKHYNLRRYFPSDTLKPLVEQYWFVDWKLPSQKTHLQQNLPDPNFHLTFEKNQAGKYSKAGLLGPISKYYQYRMSGTGTIIGVKFTIGALSACLAQKPSYYVDKLVAPNTIINELSLPEIKKRLEASSTDEQIFELLEESLKPYVTIPSKQQLKVQALVSLIKETPSLSSVSELASISGISERNIQRGFSKNLGLSAKWLIRKYRLQQAIELLDTSCLSLADIATSLGYSDQSHFIKDCKEIIGYTPANYKN